MIKLLRENTEKDQSPKIALSAGGSLTYIEPSMATQFLYKVPLLAVGLALLLTLSGCDAPGVGPDEEIDLISNPDVSLNDDTGMFYTGIRVTTGTTATVDSVYSELYLIAVDSAASDSLFGRVTLLDDGTAGDILPADGLYAAVYASPLPGGSGGDVRVDFTVTVSGRATAISDTLALVNLKPVILSVAAADSLTLPPANSDLVAVDTIRAVVADPDGLADIRSVQFTSQKPDSTFASGGAAFALLDNGTLGNGDAVAADGIFSIIIFMDDSAQLGTYTYRFYAKDIGGMVSDTLTHTAVISQ